VAAQLRSSDEPHLRGELDRRRCQRIRDSALAEHGEHLPPSFSSAARAPATSVLSPSKPSPARQRVLIDLPAIACFLNGLVIANPR